MVALHDEITDYFRNMQVSDVAAQAPEGFDYVFAIEEQRFSHKPKPELVRARVAIIRQQRELQIKAFQQEKEKTTREAYERIIQERKDAAFKCGSKPEDVCAAFCQHFQCTCDRLFLACFGADDFRLVCDKCQKELPLESGCDWISFFREFMFAGKVQYLIRY